MNICTMSSPLGTITLASDGEFLTGLWLEGQRHFVCPSATDAELPIFVETKRWLSDYFQGKNPGPTPPLAPKGTPFQMEVWDFCVRSLTAR